MGRKYIADDRSHVGRRGAAEWIMDTTLPLLARWTRRKPRRRQNDSSKTGGIDCTLAPQTQRLAICYRLFGCRQVEQALASVRVTSCETLQKDKRLLSDGRRL